MPGKRHVSKAGAFLWFMLFLFMLVALMAIHGGLSRARYGHVVEEDLRLARRLGLTDLCLFTEARYTRHPAMADFGTAFQDHPLSLEHFPSGSVIPPPPHLAGKRGERGLD